MKRQISKKLRFVLFTVFLLLCSGTAYAETKPLSIWLGNDVAILKTTENCLKAVKDNYDWQNQLLRKLDFGHTYCLYKKVHITTTDLPVNPAIIFSALGSSEIYWDGEKILQNGIVGDDEHEEIPGKFVIYKVLSKSQLSVGEHDLVIRFSNHHLNEELSGNMYTLALVDSDKLKEFATANTFPAFVFIGALLPFALIFLLIYFIYQKDIRYLVFSLLSLLGSGILFIEKLKDYYNYSYDFHLPRLHLIMIMTYLVCLLLPTFYLLSYQVRKNTFWIASIALVIGLVFMIDPRYDAKSLMMFASSLTISLIIQILALRQKQTGSFIGAVAISLAMLMLFLMPFDFIEQWFGAVFSMLILTNIYLLVKQFADERQKALNSERLQNELLRRNLQPHYLMNSLMLIIEWIEQKPKAAISFVNNLASEFRILNTMSKKTLVPVVDEIQLCRNHLSIMTSRKQANYALEVNTSADIQSLLIPPAIIHTLVENAFSHNKIPDGSIFKLNLEVKDGQLKVTLRVPYVNKTHKGSGTGEAYVKSRLNESFGKAWSFESNAKDKEWVTMIQFPEKL